MFYILEFCVEKPYKIIGKILDTLWIEKKNSAGQARPDQKTTFFFHI